MLFGNTITTSKYLRRNDVVKFDSKKWLVITSAPTFGGSDYSHVKLVQLNDSSVRMTLEVPMTYPFTRLPVKK